MASLRWVCALCLLLLHPLAARCEDGADRALLDALVRAYPQFLLRHDGGKLFWRDGTVMPVSDGVAHKSYRQLLTTASIIDQLRLPYLRGRPAAPPAFDADPGRFRNTAFFRKMYGDCRRGEVRAHLASLAWLPRSWGRLLLVSKINGIAERLARISRQIDALPASIRRAAYPSAGTFACRSVRDTGRPSMHAYGAAIDLNVEFSDYWLWNGKESNGHIRYRNRIPWEIVDIFEKNGFIWGGKWYHDDTMHFEYRPELMADVGAAKRYVKR